MHLTTEEQALLAQIKTSPRFPVVRFELHSSREKSLVSIALNHVRMTSPEDSMEEVKGTSSILRSLEEQGLVEIVYTLPVTVRSDYAVYEESTLFRMLCELVEEGAGRPDYLFDSARIRRGKVALTAKGENWKTSV